MQFSTLVAALATATTAAAAATSIWNTVGNRYVDTECKQLHSKPHQSFKTNECISTETFKSIDIKGHYVYCNGYSDRGCREHKKMVISPNDERCFTMKDIQNVASFQCFQNKD